MHGLNTYDYHARQQDFQTGRFTSVDPLAEKYYSWSPYHLAGNNPILNIDPFGMDYWSTNDPVEIERFLNSIKNASSVHDFSGWNHVSDEKFISSLENGKYTLNDETGILYMSIGFIDNGVAGVLGISLQVATLLQDDMDNLETKIEGIVIRNTFLQRIQTNENKII